MESSLLVLTIQDLNPLRAELETVSAWVAQRRAGRFQSLRDRAVGAV